jgi:hypothetical protein
MLQVMGRYNELHTLTLCSPPGTQWLIRSDCPSSEGIHLLSLGMYQTKLPSVCLRSTLYKKFVLRAVLQ